jgi:hypothetical protein
VGVGVADHLAIDDQVGPEQHADVDQRADASLRREQVDQAGVPPRQSSARATSAPPVAPIATWPKWLEIDASAVAISTAPSAASVRRAPRSSRAAITRITPPIGAPM